MLSHWIITNQDGLIKMQSGTDVKFPLQMFVDTCNSAVDLTDVHDTFYNTLLSQCASTDEEKSNFKNMCAKFRLQSGGGLLMGLRKFYQPIWVMDKMYFLNKFNKIMAIKIRKATKYNRLIKLYKEFYNKMTSAISLNEQNFKLISLQNKMTFIDLAMDINGVYETAYLKSLV